MKRLAVVVALAVFPAAPAVAHPGHGAEAVTIEGDAQRFDPAEVTVGVNESVVWFWQGVVSRDHSVTADPGQAESFDSDPGAVPTNQTHPDGDSFSHVFREEGRFTYHCKVHPNMTGVVNVAGLGGSGSLRLNALRAADRGDTVHVRFFLSKRADLVIRLTEWRKARWRPVKTFNDRGRKGRNEVDLPARSLDPGRYRVQVTAYDAQAQPASLTVPLWIDEDR